MWRGILVVFLCTLSFLPGVVRADAIQGRTVSEGMDCDGNDNVGIQGAGGWWSTVCRPAAIDGVAINAPFPAPDPQALQAYEVGFTEQFGSNNGAIPTGEFLAVVVKHGVFALDLRGDSAAEVLVTSPAGKSVKVLQPDTDDYPMEEGRGVTYTLADAPGLICELGCKLDFAQPVLLEEGYVAFLKQGTTCLICLLGQSQEFDEGPGMLTVFVLLPDPGGGEVTPADAEAFSWITDWDEFDTHRSLSHGETPTRFAWAFNPGNSRCGGG